MSKWTQFRQWLLKSIVPPLATALLRLLASTWRVRMLNADQAPTQVVSTPPKVYAMWHDTFIPSIVMFRDRPIVGLASRSFDGELIADVIQRLGYPEPARGSSSRGGAEALRSLTRGLKSGLHVTVTVDGPRGPRWQASEGMVKLAQLSGCPLMPVGIAVRGALRLRNWDKTVIPLPFARLTVAFGEAILVGRESEDLGATLTILQQQMDALTRLAQADLAN